MIKGKGTIIITLDNVSLPEISKYREMIYTSLAAGVFNVRNGKAILNFDNEGLATIETHFNKWKKDKPLIEIKALEQFKVEMTTEDKSNIAFRT